MTEKTRKERLHDLNLKIEALVMAIPNEEAAHDHYMELAEAYSDAVSREMFTFLAKEELMHKRKLESLLEKLNTELKSLKASHD